MNKGGIFTRFIGFGLVVLLLACSGSGYAQVELSSGIDMGYPILTNSGNTKINYGQISFGLRFGLSYKPTNTQFFPTLNFSVGRTRLPLQQFGDNVSAINFNYLNLMLDGNFVATLNNNNSLYFIGGIGFSSLKRSNFSIAGKNGDAMQFSLDSAVNVNNVFPAINLGVEYVYGESVNRNLYMSLGLNFQYIMLLQGRNTYYSTIRDNTGKLTSYNTSLTGNTIMPNFYISLHYLLGKNIIFWRKKSDDNFYL